MRSQIWKQMVWVFCLLFLMESCVKHDIYQGEDPSVDPQEPTKEKEDYIAQFENFENIQVSISSQHEGTLYSIYYEYPYEEGSLVKDPYLIGKTPIHMALEVPKHVKKLYILRGDGELIESDVKDITIGSDTKSSLRATNAISDEVLHLINNKYIPEKAYNVKSEDLYRCSDLKITETVFTSSFEKADIWLTYISDGGMSKGNSNMHGKIWFYTYPSEKMENLTLDDCTFYGKTNGAIQVTDFNTINQGDNYIFYSKEEQPKAQAGEYTRIPLGRFDKGLNVGFVYRGTDRPQFSTPALNGPDNNKVPDNGTFSHNYVGHTLKYGNSSFKIEKNVANGFIHHIQEGDFEGNVLGMENRCPNYRAYDGDYNDMLCLIESNPVAIEPAEPVTPPVIESQTNKKGFLLFEDNYPNQGDFDFNDAVIYYSITAYTDKSTADVYAQLLAKGCTFHNQFGFKDANGLTPFFSDVNGYVNVRKFDKEPESGITKTLTYSATQLIMPYIDNGKGPVSKNVKNTDLYPYVLDIPYSESQPFRWCIENKSIDEAYNFDQDYRKAHGDWYETPKDESLVIQFTTPDEEKKDPENKE